MKKTINKEEGVDQICQACGICENQGLARGTLCAGLSQEMSRQYEYPETFPKTYDGLRFTADAMDCSLPLAMDSHSGCAYNCLYCFSNNLQRAPDRNSKSLQRIIKEGSFYSEWNVTKLEKFLNRELKDKVSQAMYPLLDAGTPIQLGALGDPFDDLEEQSGWAKKAIPLLIKYGVPVRVGTKGGRLLQKPEYLKLFEDSPDQFWFAFSIISNSDDLISKVDINAPVTSERLKAMDMLTKMGCKASIRFRPFLPGISDSYPGEPEAWKTLITRARESGAGAISFEYIFLNPVPTPRQTEMYRLMFNVMRKPQFWKEWMESSNQSETCRRSSRAIKYEMTKKVKDHVHDLGMNFGISDPHFKEWNDSGSCCGMTDSGDKWFSNWSRRQMTEVVVQARKSYERGEERFFNYQDWKPQWAHKVPFTNMVSAGNWHNSRRKKNVTFGSHMRIKWNNPNHPRGPFKYFAGVLFPVGIDEKTQETVYKYRPWETGDELNNIFEYNL